MACYWFSIYNTGTSIEVYFVFYYFTAQKFSILIGVIDKKIRIKKMQFLAHFDKIIGLTN